MATDFHPGVVLPHTTFQFQSKNQIISNTVTLASIYIYIYVYMYIDIYVYRYIYAYVLRVHICTRAIPN